MNKKVLKTMIALVVIFLVGLYVLKIFFPEQFVFVINNQNAINIGKYIDNNLWLHIILACVTSFITYWLYLGATTRKWILNYKEIIAILIVIAITQTLYSFNETISIASGISIISMICLPMISNASLKDVAFVFSLHYMSQLLSTLIRGLPLLLIDVNYIAIFLMGIESYFWLLLCYIYFNYKKGE